MLAPVGFAGRAASDLEFNQSFQVGHFNLPGGRDAPCPSSLSFGGVASKIPVLPQPQPRHGLTNRKNASEAAQRAASFFRPGTALRQRLFARRLPSLRLNPFPKAQV